MIEFKRQVARIKLSSHQLVMNNLESLGRLQWQNEKAMIAERNARLSALLLHAYEKVPYYRHLMVLNELVEKGKVRLDRFERLPFLDKTILREQYDRLQSEDLHERSWYENTSGGSTGIQAKFIQDECYKDWSQANKLLFDEWSGRRIGDKQIKLWGSLRDLLVGKETLRTQAGRWLRNEVWLNAYNMTEDRMDVYIGTINRFRPVQILAYVESIYELARYIAKKGVAIHSPRSIMTTAGVLTEDMRHLIEDVFQTEVYNRYGSREVGDIACECGEHSGLHVSEYCQYVEIVRDDGTPAPPGEIGHIAVTSLMNFAMPMIRYRIGDMGAWSETSCACGRPHRLIREVTGRECDLFITREGNRFHGTYFVQLMFHEHWITQYQIIQESLDEVRVKLVCMEGEAAEQLRRQRLQAIRSGIRSAMGEQCGVTFEFVDRIPASASGKYRFVISKVDRNAPESRPRIGIG